MQQLRTRRKRRVAVSEPSSVRDRHTREGCHRVGALEGLYLLLELGRGVLEGPARYRV
jgi:hypothetical protein